MSVGLAPREYAAAHADVFAGAVVTCTMHSIFSWVSGGERAGQVLGRGFEVAGRASDRGMERLRALADGEDRGDPGVVERLHVTCLAAVFLRHADGSCQHEYWGCSRPPGDAHRHLAGERLTIDLTFRGDDGIHPRGEGIEAHGPQERVDSGADLRSQGGHEPAGEPTGSTRAGHVRDRRPAAPGEN